MLESMRLGPRMLLALVVTGVMLAIVTGALIWAGVVRYGPREEAIATRDLAIGARYVAPKRAGGIFTTQAPADCRQSSKQFIALIRQITRSDGFQATLDELARTGTPLSRAEALDAVARLVPLADVPRPIARGVAPRGRIGLFYRGRPQGTGCAYEIYVQERPASGAPVWFYARYGTDGTPRERLLSAQLVAYERAASARAAQAPSPSS